MEDSGDGVDRRREAEAFLATAVQDFESARDDREQQRYHNACYMAEQASEKAVKAVLILEGRFVPEHEVSDALAEVVEQRGMGLDAGMGDVAFLEKYASIPRYPDPENVERWNPVEDLTDEHAREAVERAGNVLSTVETVLRDEYDVEVGNDA